MKLPRRKRLLYVAAFRLQPRDRADLERLAALIQTDDPLTADDRALYGEASVLATSPSRALDKIHRHVARAFGREFLGGTSELAVAVTEVPPSPEEEALLAS